MLTLLAALAFAAGTGPEVALASAQDVLAEVRRPGASAVVVNFWATWCQPCREEFPDIVRIGKEYRARGVRVVFVSTDFVEDQEQVRKFLAAQGVNGPSFLKDAGSDMAFIDALEPRWTGIIPATFVYDGGGRTQWFHEGKVDYPTLKKTIDDVLALAAGAAKPTRDPPQPSDKEKR